MLKQSRVGWKWQWGDQCTGDQRPHLHPASPRPPELVAGPRYTEHGAGLGWAWLGRAGDALQKDTDRKTGALGWTGLGGPGQPCPSWWSGLTTATHHTRRISHLVRTPQILSVRFIWTRNINLLVILLREMITRYKYRVSNKTVHTWFLKNSGNSRSGNLLYDSHTNFENRFISSW